MNPKHVATIAYELSVFHERVEAAARLLEEGATVPFIARYRKEATGGLDEVALAEVRDRLEQLEELDKRRDAVLKSLREQGVLNEELERKIAEAPTMAVLEDIYLPFKPKRRTRATAAREKGLGPLAERLFRYESSDPHADAQGFVDPERGVSDAEEALSGARDIMAEMISEDQQARGLLRSLYWEEGLYVSRVVEGKEAEGAKYRDYFDWREPVSKAPSHRVLAMRRGEKEGFLTLKIEPPEEKAIAILESIFVKEGLPASEDVRRAVLDAYRRLLSSSMETETRSEGKKKADQEAISVFASNLRELLLAPPLGQKRVMGIDPGFRTGCKVVCLDAQGKLIHNDTIYPLLSEKARAEARDQVKELCKRYRIEAIAVGNGTGGRETEAFLKEVELGKEVLVVMVNESGASVYSASEAAREEFPDYDLTVRGAVSIGRRLMDPLAELVKIDPKSIGVGQYQHDVDQRALKKGLDDVVISCVNAVGVEVNTASKQLLSYVSGLGPQLAKGIVSYRDENGAFASREDLKKVPRLGPKAFEQAAGFLRIRGAENPLDNTAVHPESYPVVEAMARDLGCSLADLIRDESLRKAIRKERYITDKVGMPTIEDILQELAKPGRDPRKTFEVVRFAEGINDIEDLRPGTALPGVVTNITAFGAFVDIGVHQDGLVHVSELADHFVRDPKEVVKVGQRVTVRVLSVDMERRRISLSMKSGQVEAARGPKTPKEKHPAFRRERISPVFNNPFMDALKGAGQNKKVRGH